MRSDFTPRVSILIPNYNNGRAASRNGDRDFIRDLLESLERTLRDDPTPFEVLAFDDGSTDDSLETLREWAEKRWPDGRPFLTLLEAPHCGVLSVTANKLSEAARGDILARLDGDIICLTDHWVSRLCGIFDSGPPRLGVVGPKQLRIDERIHAFGDWLLHPNGYVHIAHGEPRDFVRGAIEVDHVMGCFYCLRKQVWEELGGYDEDYLRGQTIDFGLRARLAGWSTWAVPDIEYIHAHGERKPRATTADTHGGFDRSRRVFFEKWGFDRIAPDLDVVRERYAGTPLLWNPRWFGPRTGAGVHESLMTIESSEWGRYANNERFRGQMDFRGGVAMDLIRQIKPQRGVVQYGCGAGLLGHSLAQQGVSFVGVDRAESALRLAEEATRQQKYPGPRPRFVHQDDPGRWPLDDGSVDLLLLFDVMERHPNPVSLLGEAHRVTREGGAVGIISQRKRPLEEAPTNPHHRYLPMELLNQVMAVSGFAPAMDPAQMAKHEDLILVLGRRGERLAPPASAAIGPRDPVLRREESAAIEAA